MKTNNRTPKVETISIYQFLRRIPDENAARLYVEKMVWAAGRYCPYCKSANGYETVLSIYRENANLINTALDEIKKLYLGGNNG